jgi:Derlin-2/3
MLITRTITAATVLVSVPGHLGLFSLYWVVFFKDYVFTIRQLPQLWRLVTAFCITGPQLGLILDPFFFWQYSSKLETGNPRFSQPGAYAVYLFFNAVVILVSSFSRLTIIVFNSSSLVISARAVHLSCHGSWKRGRLPLTLWQRSSFANPKERCRNVGMVGFCIEKTFWS